LTATQINGQLVHDRSYDHRPFFGAAASAVALVLSPLALEEREAAFDGALAGAIFGRLLDGRILKVGTYRDGEPRYALAV
jgi:hypothetical protein